MTRWLVIALMASLAACTHPMTTGGPGDDDESSVDASIAAPDASADAAARMPGLVSVTRADEWVAVDLRYCQSPNHAHDADASCASTCDRMDNALWDPYRSDCSGLVSWAWELPPPGRITTEFAPFKTDLTHAIEAKNLRAGDAINNSDHVMLFKAWVTQGTKATFIEEPGCSVATPYAHELTDTVTISGQTITVGGASYTAIRYDAAP